MTAAKTRLFAGLALAAAVLVAQDPKSLPRTPDGKPDFSGIYEWPKTNEGEKCACSATIFNKAKFPPLKPGGEPLYEPRTGDPRHDEPRDFCLPAGFPSGMLSANAVRFVQNKTFLVMAHEFQAMTRLIPLDGRPHRKGLEPGFYGDPTGHWEGDTLVVESNNFRDDEWLDIVGTPTTDELKMTERFTRIDYGHMNIDITIDDPKAFTKPWTVRHQQEIMPDSDIIEFICQENNHFAPR